MFFIIFLPEKLYVSFKKFTFAAVLKHERLSDL